MKKKENAEQNRLLEDQKRLKNWKRWGPYLAERQWSTVREDYSPDGECWDYFSHDQAISRAYRWGEDGLLGITDREGRLCFSVALWNGRDPFLKERLFGLTGPEGNHGEDVKEEYFYIDSTPTHSYMKGLYKYPQAEFPYQRLREENRVRTREDPEFEIRDTGVFAENQFFDVQVEYAKAGPDDLLIRISMHNRGPDPATLHLLPTLWFRNTWSWGCAHEGCTIKPRITSVNPSVLLAEHDTLGPFTLKIGRISGVKPDVLFTENETNNRRLFGAENASVYVKDAFHRWVVDREKDAINTHGHGTKAAFYCPLKIDPDETQTVTLRLSARHTGAPASGSSFDAVFERRIREADDFYESVLSGKLSPVERDIARQAAAGLLWNKQFYHYSIKDWLSGDPGLPPPDSRKRGRNAEWSHVFCRDVLSVPDKWEYPWFAAWDSAFHMIPLAVLDSSFAKEQLVLLLREWYMHPNGQIPAYEFEFGDVNPPVHAWAAWRVYKISGARESRDRDFLERIFQKLLLNFTWWVNRKDAEGRNLFSGGFLGMDNIGAFNRSDPLPDGGTLQQADGTAWMGFYSLTMMAIAMELVPDGNRLRVAYGDMASKFFEHFVQICDAINTVGGEGLWDETDGFYYDRIRCGDGTQRPLKVRSMVGLLPLIAVTVLEQTALDRLPGFKKRFEWFLTNRQDLARHISCTRDDCRADEHRWLLALLSRGRLIRILHYLLDEGEFLSPYGIRSLSKFHQKHPFVFRDGAEELRVEYVPGESNSGLFGGNSNWRGPVWFPVNYLIIEALERYHHYYGDRLKVECPTGSGQWCTLREVSAEIARRLTRLFLPDENGARPCLGESALSGLSSKQDDLVLFHEYFHAETGRGLGAGHQTGWTALIMRCLEKASRPMAD